MVSLTKEKKNLEKHKWKGGVHIWGEICPRSDPDIAHMGYYLDPIKFIYKTLSLYGNQGARF